MARSRRFGTGFHKGVILEISTVIARELTVIQNIYSIILNIHIVILNIHIIILNIYIVILNIHIVILNIYIVILNEVKDLETKHFNSRESAAFRDSSHVPMPRDVSE